MRTGIGLYHHRVASVAWSPASLSGLFGWWDASNAGSITAAGGAVSQWNDLSGNGNHFVQGTGSKQPTTGSSTMNGLNALAFDGGDLMRVSSLSSTLWADYITWAVVFKKTGAAASFEACPVTLTSSNAARTFDGWRANRFVDTSGGAIGGTYTNIESQTSACVLLAEGDRVATTYAERLDGSAAGSTSGIGTWSTTSQVLICGSRDDEVTALRGDVAEIVIVNAAISSADRTLLEDYLSAKWGTP